jgi:hypothetical protein
MKTKVLTCFVVCLSITACTNPQNDFDAVCQYFDELQNVSDLNSMSNADRFEFINNRINKHLKQESYAYITWDALMLSHEERYAMFSKAASETLNQNWVCESMKILASTAVYPIEGSDSTLPPGVVEMKDAQW